MKDYVVKALDRFVDITEGFNTPLKFYETDGDSVRAECNLRVLMVSFEGKKADETVQKLRTAGFSEVIIRETKPMVDIE